MYRKALRHRHFLELLAVTILFAQEWRVDPVKGAAHALIIVSILLPIARVVGRNKP